MLRNNERAGIAEIEAEPIAADRRLAIPLQHRHGPELGLAKIELPKHVRGLLGHHPIAISCEQIRDLVMSFEGVRSAENYRREVVWTKHLAALVRLLDFDQASMIALGDVVLKWPLVRWVLYCPADPHDFAHGGRMTTAFSVRNGWKADIRNRKTNHMKMVGKATLAVLLASAGNSMASSQEVESPPCYDALVSARIVRQIPSVIPECGPDCIVMRWPWFDDLDIKDVVKGQAPTGRVTVLALQHTYLIPNEGRWPLRRNELGGFNVVEGGDLKKLTLCPPNTPAARPYIRPTNGRTLADLIREGEERYGEGPHTRPQR